MAMREIKTKLPEGRGYRGELRVLRKLSDYEFGVELWVLRDGPNENNWDFQNLEDNYLTFQGKPILCAYVGSRIGDGHNMRERRDMRTGKTYQSFTDATAERIVGTLSDDPGDLSLVPKDGHTWIVAKGRLWAFYAPELVEKIVRTGRMEVSAEIDTKGESLDTDGGVEVYTAWEGLGVTILGDDVPPAVPGAHIAALAAMREEFARVKLRAASLSRGTPKTNKTTSREGVRKPMNKRDVARLAPKFEGYRIVGLSEDCMRVALVDKTGAPYTYTFHQEDGGQVIGTRLTPAKLSVSFAFCAEEGETQLSADLADIVDFAVGESAEQCKNAEELSKELEQAKAAIQKMEEMEHARRLESVKEAVQATLAELADAAEGDDESMEDEGAEAEKNAEEYAAMEKDGAFCGDKQARADLMAAFSEKRVEKMKKAAAAKKNAFAWENLGRGDEGGDAGGIEDMLNFLNS